jgi:hypothetical protein
MALGISCTQIMHKTLPVTNDSFDQSNDHLFDLFDQNLITSIAIVIVIEACQLNYLTLLNLL